jgi:hypothetical protein
MKFEGDVRLTFAAAEHFPFELLLVWDFAAIPTNQFRSLLEGGACLCFTLVVVFPTQCVANWAFHKR